MKMGRIQSPSVPAIGDVVIVKDDTSRGCWKMGKIMNLFKSRDGQIRSAKVKLSPSKVINRPLNLLYPIEMSHGDREKKEEENQQKVPRKKGDVPLDQVLYAPDS